MQARRARRPRDRCRVRGAFGEADALPRPGDAEPLALCGGLSRGTRRKGPSALPGAQCPPPAAPGTGHCSRAPGRERRKSNWFIKQPGPGLEEEEVKTNDWNESVGFNERPASAVTMENSL